LSLEVCGICGLLWTWKWTLLVLWMDGSCIIRYLIPSQGLCFLQSLVSWSRMSPSSSNAQHSFKSTWQCSHLFIIRRVFIKYLNVEFCSLLCPHNRHNKTEKSELTNPVSIIQWRRCSGAMSMCHVLWLPTATSAEHRSVFILSGQGWYTRRCYNASCRLAYSILYLDIVRQVSVTVHLSPYIVYEKHKLKFLLRADLTFKNCASYI
jgi:hypothetical protein